jgi:predicted dehydrogenase
VPHATSLGPVLDLCDMVYIGTTPNAHAPLVLEALAAGKHVLMEKPLAATPADADAIVGAAEAAEALQVGMNIGMRWNPALHELRRLAVTDGGTIGTLKSARLSMHYTMWPREWQVQPWCAARAEGGPLREVGTHCASPFPSPLHLHAVALIPKRLPFPAAETDSGSSRLSEAAALLMRVR